MNNFTINKQIKILQNSVMENNTIIYCIDDSVYVIDPSFEASSIYQQYNNFKNKYVILTHSHFDHIGDVLSLNQFAHKIYMSSAVKDIKNQLDKKIFYDIDLLDWNKVEFIDDKQVIGDIHFYHTPGHSADSMCIVIGDVMIAGDHVFATAIGRTDLPTSNPKQMYESILYFKEILKDKNIQVMIPGHGKYVSVEDLLKFNHYLLVK